MTVRHLKIFITVCDELNMTKAAEKLFISQPSVSQAIKELEHYYEVRLFERLGKKIYITPRGEKLLHYARHIVHLYDEMDNSMKTLKDHESIRIGATVTIGTYLLFDILKNYHFYNDEEEVSSIVGNTSFIENKLLLDEIDLGLVEGIIRSNDLIIQPFMTDELVLVFPCDHELNKKENITIEEIIKYPFVLREVGSGTREIFEQEIKKKGINIKITGEFNNIELIKNAVVEHLGITVISKQAIIKDANNQLNWKPISDLRLGRNFSLVYHKNKYLSLSIQLMLNTIKNLYIK